LKLLTLFAVATVSPAATVLTFEGLADSASVGNYYSGGGGPNYGITFVNATALIDSDAGGTGTFANEPSPNTIMYFPGVSSATMNVPGGFTTGLAFYYVAGSPGQVDVYSGLNGTGSLLATINLVAQAFDNGCTGDPTGAFCNWSPVGVGFSGIAQSVVFIGLGDLIGFDNITLGDSTPGGVVPEPTTLLLTGSGLALAGWLRRRRP
jgi:hypothetical protein